MLLLGLSAWVYLYPSTQNREGDHTHSPAKNLTWEEDGSLPMSSVENEEEIQRPEPGKTVTNIVSSPTTPPQPSSEERELRLSLPREEVEKLADPDWVSRLDVITERSKTDDPSIFSKTSPPSVGVQFTDRDTPIVQYHFEQKGAEARKADLLDKLDGVQDLGTR